MGAGGDSPIAELAPRDAWALLSDDADAVLIDVRSAAEWGFVGGPDLSALGRAPVRLEWQSWPGMRANDAFVDEALAALGDGAAPVLFLCRSGVRSMAAARAVHAALDARGGARRCVNVAEGFEGDLDEDGHRGRRNGWKARGLPWVQT